MKILSGVKSRKKPIVIVVIILEFLVCLVLLYTLSRGAGITLGKGGFRLIPKEQNEEIQRLQSVIDGLMEKYDVVVKTMVALEEHNRVVNENNRLTGRIRAMRDAAVAAGKLSAAEPLATPEQICMAMEQMLRKPEAPPAPKINEAEVDMLISAVSNEISQRGAIDTKQTEKYGVGIYLIQKVLDAAGYPVNEADGVKNTYDAVMKFQGDQQLKQDGKVGMGTWGKVREFWVSKKTSGQASPGQRPAAPAAVKQQPLTITVPPLRPQPAVQTPAGQNRSLPIRRER